MKFCSFALVILITGCSTFKKEVPVYKLYSPNILKDKGEQTVSVNSSIQLAHNSYVAGCIQEANSTPEGKAKRPHMKKCLKRAKSYITDIENIMKQ